MRRYFVWGNNSPLFLPTIPFFARAKKWDLTSFVVGRKNGVACLPYLVIVLYCNVRKLIFTGMAYCRGIKIINIAYWNKPLRNIWKYKKKKNYSYVLLEFYPPLQALKVNSLPLLLFRIEGKENILIGKNERRYYHLNDLA